MKKIPPIIFLKKYIFTHDRNPKPHLTGSLFIRVLY
jgi:hypothetical protein